MIKVGIADGAGYTGGELIRILLNHPSVEIVFVHSNSNAGNHLYHVHHDLLGETDLKFSAEISHSIDVLFLCVGHGDGKKFMEKNKLPSSIKIIDLSQDFRLNAHATLEDRTFIYGLPELNKTRIQHAQNIANPGCFATCIQLALLPLAQAKLLQHPIQVAATTGSTGAGQSPSATSHFSWRQNNLSSYKEFEHQHLKEIRQSLQQAYPTFSQELNFIPYRGNFTRGILASVYTHCALPESDVRELYENYYQEHPFTHICKQSVDLKPIVNTNKCFIHLEKHDHKLLITAAIDNLLKGASGQAVQNMNLLFGLEETVGLKLKSIAF